MTNIQVALDIELSQMWKRLREIHGLETYKTEDLFACSDMFLELLSELEEENDNEMV